MEGRCTGHCCKRFTVNLEKLTDPQYRPKDEATVLGMLIPLGPDESDGTDDGTWWCTCRNFDGLNCTIYETRPNMCRDFPYGKPCPFAGCTMTGVGVAREPGAVVI